MLLMWLMVLSLVAATTVHALELPGTALECSGDVHLSDPHALADTIDMQARLLTATHAESQLSDLPPEHAPADSGQTMAHHHGCHSASSLVVILPADGLIPLPTAGSYAMQPAAHFSGLQPDPALRPPKA